MKRLLLADKFNQDVLWNVGALIVLGMSGVIMNVIIARYMDLEALGVFNQLYAIFIIQGQLSVFGIQFSVLKHISHNENDDKNCSEITGAAVILVLIISSLVVCLVYFLSETISGFFSSESMDEGIKIIAIAAMFFSMNKNAFNGLEC